MRNLQSISKNSKPLLVILECGCGALLKIVPESFKMTYCLREAFAWGELQSKFELLKLLTCIVELAEETPASFDPHNP